jgi:ATP-dependent Clp protease adaptor protein ClpS
MGADVIAPTVGGRATMEAMTTPVEQKRTEADPAGAELVAEDRPWQTIVWNDPVNLMSYVTYVFQKLFGYPKAKATKLMLDVHHKGKAIVSSGDKDKVENDVARLHAAGLWATMERT